jgi:hypothetical protein
MNSWLSAGADWLASRLFERTLSIENMKEIFAQLKIQLFRFAINHPWHIPPQEE